MAFRVLILGGTGQVGAAVVRALVAEPSCDEVVMVNRKAIPLAANPRLQQVILDTAVAQFPAEVTKIALSMVALGDPVYGAPRGAVRTNSAVNRSANPVRHLPRRVVGDAHGAFLRAWPGIQSSRGALPARYIDPPTS